MAIGVERLEGLTSRKNVSGTSGGEVAQEPDR